MKNIFLVTIFLIALLFLLGGCGSPECSVDTDCSAAGTCLTATCSDGVCTTTPKADCCGNARCEAAAGENACSCPTDCKIEGVPSGKCEGKVQVPNKYRSSVMEDAEYAQYYCNDADECVVGVPEALVEEKQFFSESRTSLVKFQVVASISKPYVVGQGAFNYQITFSDNEETRARPPIVLTSAQVLYRDELIGQQLLTDVTFDAVGNVYSGTIPLSPSLDAQEEERSLTLKIFYEYQEVGYETVDRERVEVLTTERSSFTMSFDDLIFVDNKVH